VTRDDNTDKNNTNNSNNNHDAEIRTNQTSVKLNG
jgi:hypothetical protein